MSFRINIIEATTSNTDYRRELFTAAHSQLVVMALKPGSEIGKEVHPDHDQILVCVQGHGKAILNGNEKTFTKNDLVVVPAGTEHNFINTGSTDLKLYTIYAPAHHAAGTVHATQEDASKYE
ncbi:MAG: cupin domain-containing protein [Candidatus Babeliales bacterium]